MTYKLVLYGDTTQQSPIEMMLGKKEVKSPTVEDLIRIHELDTWEAEKIPNHNEYSEKIENSFHIRRHEHNPQSQYHNRVLTPFVREGFKVLQYDKGVRWLEPFLMEELLEVDSSLMLDYGTKFSVLCNINVEAQVAPGDTVNRYLLLALSHDTSSRGLFYCDTRPICANTLAMAKAEGSRSPEKNFVFDPANPDKSLEKARQLIDLTTQKFHNETVQYYRAFSKQDLENSQVDYIFRTILNLPLGSDLDNVSERKLNQYQDLKLYYNNSPGMELITGDTGWRVLNAVTYFSKDLGKTEDKSYQTNMFGAGNRLRNQTNELLTSLLPTSAIPV